MSPDAAPAMLAAARSLAVDRVTAEVVTALDGASVPSILLKGPAIAGWLYRDAAPRPYGDSDVLVPPDAGERAGAVLEELGFSLVPGEEVPHGRPWVERKYVRRRDRAVVDLHRGLEGVDVARLASWSVLSERTEPLRVGGRDVTVLDEAARTFHVAMHAFQHGAEVDKPLEDLRRAATTVAAGVWEDAAGIARRLDVADRFAAGLRLVPEGAAVADRLRLPHTTGAETALIAGGAQRFTKALAWFRQLDGAKAKLAFVARAVVPPASYLRSVDPRSRGPWPRLVLGYLRRAWMLARHAPAALRAVARARRSSR